MTSIKPSTTLPIIAPSPKKLATTSQKTVKTDAPAFVNGGAKKKEPFVGPVIWGIAMRLPEIAAQLPDLKPVSVALPGATQKYHKRGIFFEAEAKLEFGGDKASIPARAEALANAMEKATHEGIEALLPAGKAGQFAGMTVVPDKKDSAQGTKFTDYYCDDAKGTLRKLQGRRDGFRARFIGDNPDGKIESKLGGTQIDNSSVMGRFEVTRSTFGIPGANPMEVIANAVKMAIENPDDMTNPVVVLKKEHPELDLNSFKPRTENVANRKQYVFKRDGEDAFISTVDEVHVKNLDTGKTGMFNEVEIERMDGSIQEKDLRVLMELTEKFSQKFDLRVSPGTKYQQGVMATAE